MFWGPGPWQSAIPLLTLTGTSKNWIPVLDHFFLVWSYNRIYKTTASSQMPCIIPLHTFFPVADCFLMFTPSGCYPSLDPPLCGRLGTSRASPEHWPRSADSCFLENWVSECWRFAAVTLAESGNSSSSWPQGCWFWPTTLAKKTKTKTKNDPRPLTHLEGPICLGAWWWDNGKLLDWYRSCQWFFICLHTWSLPCLPSNLPSSHSLQHYFQEETIL